METNSLNNNIHDIEVESTSSNPAPPWEMIEAGRYRPRRIRGSYRGRELG